MNSYVNINLSRAQAEEEELRILRAAEECAPPAPAEEVGAPCFSGDITLTVKGPAVTLSPEQARTPAPQGSLGFKSEPAAVKGSSRTSGSQRNLQE